VARLDLPRLLFIVAAVLLIQTGWASRVAGQDIHVDVQSARLVDVLEQLRVRSGIDVVYADRLVEGIETTCRFEGDDPAEALRCILNDTGLVAERVRRRQFVVRPQAHERPDGTGDDSGSPARASIAGFVRDANTGELLPGAHVVIPALRIGASTNDAGYFAVPSLPKGEYVVRVSYIGYQSVDLSLRPGDAAATIRLEPTPFESQGVTIEADRSHEQGFPPPSGVVAVPVRELERLPSFPGEQDLLHALQWFPGVQKAGEVNGALVIRGGSPDQNLYLIDGAPVYHPWHAFSLISTFQTETFSDVKLYRGAFPAHHGGRISSVLDAQLKDGNRDGPRATGAIGMLSGRFMIESPISNRSSFMVSGRRSYLDKLIGTTHAVEDASGRRDTLRTDYFFHDLAGKLSFSTSDWHRLSVSYYRGGDQLDLRLPFDLSLDFSSWLRPADLYFEIDQFWTNSMTSMRYQYIYGTRFFSTLTAYRSAYRAREGFVLRPTTESNLLSSYTVKLEDVGFKWDAEWYFALDHDLHVGLHVADHLFRSNLEALVFRSVATVDTMSEYSRQRALETALYAQTSWRPRSNLRVQPGVRVAHFGEGGFLQVSPRLGLQYAPLPDVVMLRAATGRYEQYMHRLRDRHSFLYDLVSSRWIPTSDEVQPSSSIHFTAGVETRPVRALTISSDVYWYETDNVLLPRDDFQTKDGLDGPGIDVSALLGQYVQGDARSYGFELNASLEHRSWEFLASYTGSRSLTRFDEDTFRPGRFDVPRTFRGLLGYTWQGLTVRLSGDIRSGYPHTVPVARYVLGDPLSEPHVYLHRPEINNGRLPPYFHTDLTFQYAFRWGGARWSAQVHLFNITNRRNVLGRQYVPVNGTVDVRDRRGLPMLPLFEIEMRI
jgi:hypothetical protein